MVLMADALAGRAVVIDQSVIPAKDGCPARFRLLRDDYVASCRVRGNAGATVAAKDKAVSRFLGYLDEVGAGDLAALGVRDVSGFLLRQRGLRRKTIAGMRSSLADFLDFLAAAGRTPQSLARRGLEDDRPVAGGELLPLRPCPLRPRRPRLLRRRPRRPGPQGTEPGEEDRGSRRQGRQASPCRRRDRPGARAGRAAQPRPRHHHGDHQRDDARLDAPVDAARRKLQTAQDDAKAVPARIPLSQHNPDMVKLDTETKLITHAIRMAAYNAETILARTMNSHYARAGDEAYALIREALTASGDIIPCDGTLTIRLDPLSAPRRTHAIARLCDQLNTTTTRYPGTQLVLRYEIKNHPGTA